MTATLSAPVPFSFDTQPYSVKRHGLTLDNCVSEPIQTPGCVQDHGALLVLRLSDLSILQVSENSQAVLGHTPEDLLGQPAATVIGTPGQLKVRDMLASEPTECNPLYVLTLPASEQGQFNAASTGVLDVTMHTINGVAILEFESMGRTNLANPDYYALVKKTVSQLQSADSLQQFCDSVAHQIRELTGMDRALVYKFHADGHGEVFAESRLDGLHSWMGLHYPAEDIPKQARDIFCKTWIRPIPDMSHGLAELVPLVNPDTGKPLEMTYCALRGVSIMCTEYFRNMGVAATLTMSIRRNDVLWGLITCHHYSGPKYLSYQVRAACEFLAQVVSMQHHSAEEKEHLAYCNKLERTHQQLVALATEGGGLAALTGGTPSLLDGIDAGGAAMYHLERWWRLGTTPSEAELDPLAEWLVLDKFASTQQPLYATDRLARDYPAAAAFAQVASGLLAVPIGLGGRNMMLWFRPETMQTVNWGGDPHGKPTVLGPNGPRLTPRRSFELFVESVHERSLPWLEVEIEAAASLRLVVMEMVVDRAARLATLNADLLRSNEELDAFAYVASHDLKEPLRGIAQYATQLLDDSDQVDAQSRAKLDRLKQLTLRMDSLLDSLLHFSRVGRAELTLEEVDLNGVLTEALDMVSSRTAVVKVSVPKALPAVQAQRVWCREILVNLLSNAQKFSDQPVVEIEVGHIEAGDPHPRPGCPAELTAHTIFYVADNGIGIDPRHFAQVFKLFKRLHGRDEYGGGGGVGLTIVRKLVERHHGRVWLDSGPGQGTTVYFTLSSGDMRSA
jgi:chemotaxis family two-component system sensor kinase Cph1